MNVDVSQCLVDLIRCHFRSTTSAGRVGISNPIVIRKLKRKCYQILLSHRGSDSCDEKWGNIFDLLYTECYRMKTRFENSDKLSDLVDVLWRMDCLEVRNALEFLLNLSSWEERNDVAECQGLKSISGWNSVEAIDQTAYTRFPTKSNNWFEIPRVKTELQDVKSVTSAVNYFRIPLSPSVNSVESSRGARDRWLYNDRFEIPELSDECGEQTYRFPPRLCLNICPAQAHAKDGEVGGGKVEVDEGFEETVTPSSLHSFNHPSTRTPSDDHSWWVDLVATAAHHHAHPHTWEYLKCVDPPLEKPLPTEGGCHVVDHIVECYLGDLYIVCPEEVDNFRRISFNMETQSVIRCLLLVLVAVPSSVFTYNQASRSFEARSVVIPGFSPTALRHYLGAFGECGSHHRWLEEAVVHVSQEERSGLVLRALIEGVRRYLQHTRTIVTAMFSHLDVYRACRLLQLDEDTVALRQHTFSIAQLLGVTGERGNLHSLPKGFTLIRHIHQAVVGSQFNPWFITLFKWSLQPYLSFLQDWAFEGRNWDQHGEFPVRPNVELHLSITDEKWWSEGYALETQDDPILGSKLLSQVFVCGKTLLMLRHCCPLHPLFSMTCKRPHFNLGLSEESVESIELEWRDYFSRINVQLHRPISAVGIEIDSETNIFHISNESHCAVVSSTTETSAGTEPEHDQTPARPAEEPNYKATPYNFCWPDFSGLPMVDIAERVVNESVAPLSSKLEFNGLVLPAMIRRCITEPLMTQVSLVNRVAVQYVLQDLKLKDYFQFFANHFFMQDGEFSQSLCNLLFNHLMAIERPTQLLNRMTLNAILDEACSQSIGRDNSCLTEFRAKLSFSVRYVPNNFRKRSVTVLECLRLTHRPDWPITFVITAEAQKHYQFIFNFLLQLRLCLWSLSEIYHILKLSDPSSSSSSTLDVHTVHRYRRVQFYRQDMLHFIKSVHAHLNLMAFQKSFQKFQDDVERVRCIDDLILSHNAYLKKVAFRCLLTKVAAPLMKILKDVFASVLEFHWWLLDADKPPVQSTSRWNDENTFELLTKTYKEFKQHSSLLAKAWLEKQGSRNHDGTKGLPTTLCKLLDAVARL